MARVMGKPRDNEIFTQLTIRLKVQRTWYINPSWTDFKTVRFTERRSSRLDGTKLCAQTTMTTSRMKVILLLNSQGPNSPMKQREDHADAVKIKDRWY